MNHPKMNCFKNKFWNDCASPSPAEKSAGKKEAHLGLYMCQWALTVRSSFDSAYTQNRSIREGADFFASTPNNLRIPPELGSGEKMISRHIFQCVIFSVIFSFFSVSITELFRAKTSHLSLSTRSSALSNGAGLMLRLRPLVGKYSKFKEIDWPEGHTAQESNKFHQPTRSPVPQGQTEKWFFSPVKTNQFKKWVF